jgi:hypothetical protein
MNDNNPYVEDDDASNGTPWSTIIAGALIGLALYLLLTDAAPNGSPDAPRQPIVTTTPALAPATK